MFIDCLPESQRDLFVFGPVAMNGMTTVVMVPDGSNEGWEDSDNGDLFRNIFVTELEKAKYEDGSNPWQYVEVGYGEYGKKIIRSNCKNMYSNAEYACGYARNLTTE